MSELTKEYFDQENKLTREHLDEKLSKLGEKFITKEFFEEKLKDLATKDDLAEFELKMASKQDYDSLAIKVEKLQSTVDAIDEKVTRIDQRSDEDIRAAYNDIESLKERVTVIEKQAQ